MFKSKFILCSLFMLAIAVAENKTLEIPFYIYKDANSTAFTPLGHMGNDKELVSDYKCEENPQEGKYCIKYTYNPSEEWVGLVWQFQLHDWGNVPGGYDLTGAQKLTFYARGKEGGEEVKFAYGILQDNTYKDSSGDETGTLTLN